MASALIRQLVSTATPYLQEIPWYGQKQILFSGKDLLQEFLLQHPCHPSLASYLNQRHQKEDYYYQH